MRRMALGSAALALVIAAACSSDYTSAPEAPDAGVDAAGSPIDAAPSVPAADTGAGASLTIGKLSIPRGETRSFDVTVVRGTHAGELTVAANGAPAGVEIQPVVFAAGVTKGTLDVTVPPTAAEGGTTLQLSLLEQNAKIAEASTLLDITALRSGAIDPTFGTGGFVDLGAGNARVSFGVDGSLYAYGLGPGVQRWSPAGARDTAYGGVEPNTMTILDIAVADNGQLYFAGFAAKGDTSTAVVVRTTTDGKALDPTWGEPAALPSTSRTGVAVPAAPIRPMMKAGVVGLAGALTYVLVKPDVASADAGLPLAPVLSRLDATGRPDTTFGGTNGYLGLPLSSSTSAEGAILGSDGRVVLIARDDEGTGELSDLRKVFEVILKTPNDAMLLYSTGTSAPAGLRGVFSGKGTVVGGDFADAGHIVRLRPDGGVDATFGGPAGAIAPGSLRSLSIDELYRPLVGGCSKLGATWGRYTALEGRPDLDYRITVAAQLTCVIATRLVGAYLYAAVTKGTGAAQHVLMTRFVR